MPHHRQRDDDHQHCAGAESPARTMRPGGKGGDQEKYEYAMRKVGMDADMNSPSR